MISELYLYIKSHLEVSFNTMLLKFWDFMLEPVHFFPYAFPISHL